MTAVDAAETRRPARPERAVAAVLASLLPAAFRQRQRDEWLSDLAELADDGGARRRYLAGAAWTLPALRAHVRRAGDSVAGTVPAAPPPAALVARVLFIALGYPVFSWLYFALFQYFAFDIEARIAGELPLPFDPKDIWPRDGVFVVLVPLHIALYAGSFLALNAKVLLSVVAVVSVVVAAAYRSQLGSTRGVIATLGLVLLGLSVIGSLAADQGPNVWEPRNLGLATAACGTVALVLAAVAPSLGVVRRTALTVLGAGAICVYAVHTTPLGAAIHHWLLD